MRLSLRLGLLGFLAAAPLLFVLARPPHPSPYLVVWAMEARHPQAPGPTMPGMTSPQGLGRDFLAVFDVSPGAKQFGKLVAMVDAGPAGMAHHTSYSLPPEGVLYANDWLANRTSVFNLQNLLQPRLLRQFGSVGRFAYPHSFVYLPNGDTLATFQYSGGFNRAPGGLVEFAPDGHAVRSSAAAAAGFPNIRPYSLAVVPQLNRVVTSSADMMGAQASRVAQVWRLSDLQLLHTLVLPPPPDFYSDSATDSSEPRVLADGRSVVIPTFGCGLYLVRHLASTQPSLERVYDLGYRTCEVPVVMGKFLVMAAQSGHALVSLDMNDPRHPREVSRILLPGGDYPHWMAAEPGGDRLAITGYGAMATRVLFAQVDRRSGALQLQPQSLEMTRPWPDGWRGSAMPHGVVFSHP